MAIQQGRNAGSLIHRPITGKTISVSFREFGKGNMSVVGKGSAVLQSGKVHMSGFLAWFAWAERICSSWCSPTFARVSFCNGFGPVLPDTAGALGSRESLWR